MILEGSYAKVCLAKSSGNSLDMNFEHKNFSVALKLTEFQIFFFFSWVSADTEELYFPLKVLWCHLTLILGAVPGDHFEVAFASF